MKQKAKTGAINLLDHLRCSDLLVIASSAGAKNAENNSIDYLKGCIIEKNKSFEELLSHEEITREVLKSYIDRNKIAPVSNEDVKQELVEILCKHFGEPTRADSEVAERSRNEATAGNQDLLDSSGHDPNPGTQVVCQAMAELSTDDRSLSQALKVELGEEATFMAQLKSVGEVISNTRKNDQREMKYKRLMVGQGKSLVFVRNYQLWPEKKMNIGESYMFTRAKRTEGDDHFFLGKVSAIKRCEMIEIEANADVVENNVKIPLRLLNDALKTKSTSNVKGEVIQVTPVKTRRAGWKMHCLEMRDKQGEGSVKVVLPGECEQSPHKRGQVVSITKAYPSEEYKGCLSIKRDADVKTISDA